MLRNNFLHKASIAFLSVCRWSHQPFLAWSVKMRSTCDLGDTANKIKFSKFRAVSNFPWIIFLKIKNSIKAGFYLLSISSYKLLIAPNIFHYEISRCLVGGKQWEIRECTVIGPRGVYGEEATCKVKSRVEEEEREGYAAVLLFACLALFWQCREAVNPV